ncbi:hypothetical protein [Pelagicoccus mobilis]|uniref:Antitoxin n=1 Tax=Pelagicoccus mobilis TaxID=415221 RepID=A0A934RSM1_9BACT|nr:hypothetical protein [Pelagicoccus mobilis]MBK1875683.1 hypothetical protein [Pelagicoccus mobilis]
MRTTVDIPEQLYRQAIAKAALRGESFREYLANALRRDLETAESSKPVRLRGPLFSTPEPIAVSPDQQSDLLEEEDRALLG